MTGDGFLAAFDDALDALTATVDLQEALADPAATRGVLLRVRCGLHAGVAERRDDDYFGSPVYRAARIMSAARGGQVLMSQAVGASGTYRVPSLSLPDPKKTHTPASIAPFEAVQLFTDRALLARQDFQVTNQNASTLVAMCCRLDGIPLALELAAARVRSLSMEEINRRLDQRFRLLTGGSRTALPRQQTLRSLIDWSYDLLTDAERALFRRLAVFAGGWTLEAAENVCAGEDIDEAAVFDLLTSLVDKSLAVADERDGATRCRMLETVRQYARDRLLESGDGGRWRDRHLEHFLAVAEEAERI